MNLKGLVLGASAALLIASAAHAADEVTQEEIASKFDVAFGVAVTSQYVARGVPQSDGFALQGYIEPSYGWFYAGIWASNVGPTLGNPPATMEVDLYGGIRPTFGNLTLDLGYAHYLYNNGAANAGEIYLKSSYAFTDMFSAGAQVYYQVTAPSAFSYGEINAAISLPHDFGISGAVGTNFAGNVNWNAGVSWTYADTVTFDARVHGHTTAGTRIVGTISLASTLSKLTGK